MKETLYYNIHGFVICTEGMANKIFQKEYRWAQVSNVSNVDLYVKVYEGQDHLLTKPAGCTKGILLPFKEGEKVLWYEEGVPLNVLLSYCEALMFWPDKTILHAGGVTKNNKAFIFMGRGNVGKTSIVLSLLKENYEYLSDDWLIIGNGMAYPFPKLIHVFDYNLKNKEIASRVLGRKHFLYKPYLKIMELARTYAPHRYLRYGFGVIRPMFYVEPKTLNPNVKISSPTVISKIFFLERQNVDKIIIDDSVDPRDLARRMSYVNLYEWNFFFMEYYKYAYLYGLKNEKIENRFDHDFHIMLDTFKKCYLQKVIIPMKLDLTGLKISSILNLKEI